MFAADFIVSILTTVLIVVIGVSRWLGLLVDPEPEWAITPDRPGPVTGTTRHWLPLDLRRHIATFLAWRAPMERAMLLPELVKEAFWPGTGRLVQYPTMWPAPWLLPSGHEGMGGTCFNCGADPAYWLPCPHCWWGWPTYNGRNVYRCVIILANAGCIGPFFLSQIGHIARSDVLQRNMFGGTCRNDAAG